MTQIAEFLAQRRLAMAGVSQQPKDFSRLLFRELRNRGYEVVAVNPAAREIEGNPCYPRVQEIQPPVENVLLMTKPAVTEALVRDCAAAGVKRIWMFRGGGKGAVSDEAIQFCEAQGISVIPGECPYMYLPRTGFIHRLHRWLRKVGQALSPGNPK